MIDGNDTCKDGLLGCLFVDVKFERIVFSQKLYDLFARDIVRSKFKHVPRISFVDNLLCHCHYSPDSRRRSICHHSHSSRLFQFGGHAAPLPVVQ